MADKPKIARAKKPAKRPNIDKAKARPIEGKQLEPVPPHREDQQVALVDAPKPKPKEVHPAQDPKPKPMEREPVGPERVEPKPVQPEPAKPKPEEPAKPEAPAVAENNPKNKKPADKVKPPLQLGKPNVAKQKADGDGREGLTPEELKRFKAATIFVAAGNPRKDPDAGTGSGFVVAVRGRTVYIATNAHVVGRFKRVRAVFNSGSDGEQDLSAKVVMLKPTNDIALLEVEVNRDTKIPLPISLADNPELRETLEVFVFGFPFGRLLGGESKNPAPTIGRGFVSSLRKNDADEVMAIQIDGALNPGNSGGPILDRQGRLLGIATATVPGAQIGLAVPTVDLRTLLNGQLLSLNLRTRDGDGAVTELRVEARIEDPLDQTKKVSVVYYPRPKGWKKPKPRRIGQYDRIGGKDDELQECELQEEGQLVFGTIKLKGEEGQSTKYVVQPKITAEDGTEQFLEPFEARIGFGKARRPVRYDWGKDNPGGGGRPTEKGDWLGPGGRGGGRVAPDVHPLNPGNGSTLPRMAEHPDGIQYGPILLTEAGIIPNVLWSPKGDAFFVLDSDGVLFRVAYPSFKVAKAVKLRSPGYWTGLSSRGVIVSMPMAQQLLVFSLDLESVKAIPVATPKHFASAPSSKLVFLNNSFYGKLTVVDLVKKKAVKTLSALRINSLQRQKVKRYSRGLMLSSFGQPTMTPDGKYLFCQSSGTLHRFTIKKDRLVYDQAGPYLSGSVKRIDVSPDGRYVAMPAGGGNRASAGHPPIEPYGTYIYRTNDITAGIMSVSAGPYPTAIGFDRAAGYVYGQNHTHQLVMFTTDGRKLKEFNLTRGQAESTKQIAVHPEGKRMLVVTRTELYYVQLKE